MTTMALQQQMKMPTVDGNPANDDADRDNTPDYLDTDRYGRQ